MKKIVFRNNLPPALSETTLNQLQTNIEDVFNGNEPAGNMVVDGIRSKNMFNKNSMVYTRYGYFPYDTSSTQLKNYGGIGPATLVIKLEAGKTYTISKMAGARFRAGFTNTPTPALDTDNVITSRLSNNDTGTSITFTVPSGSIYFVCNFFSQDQTVDANIGYENMVNSIQIESGSTATSYSPYQQLDNQENYSTNEIKIGTWINGKNLYRKVYNFGQLPNASVKGMALNISNLDEITSIRGICKNESADYTTVIPQVDASNVSVQLQVYVQDNEVKVYTAGNKTAYTKSYIVIEYTKTTD